MRSGCLAGLRRMAAVVSAQPLLEQPLLDELLGVGIDDDLLSSFCSRASRFIRSAGPRSADPASGATIVAASSSSCSGVSSRSVTSPA